MKILSKDEVNALIEQEEFMPTLASLVKDRNGSQVGNAVDGATLKDLSAEKVKPHAYKVEPDLLSAVDFKDTYAKMVTRKIFNLMKDYSEWDLKSQIARLFHMKNPQ